MTSCPLCHHQEHELYHQDLKPGPLPDRLREYHQCKRCQLIFVPPAFYLSNEQEKAIYDQHENHVDDPGYRKFLSRMANPIVQRVPAQSNGLEFGCGPGPALAKIFEEAGHQISLFDLYYYPDQQVLDGSQRYDFITSTEVLEHLAQPDQILEQLWKLLKPGGYLGLMTKLAQDKTAFAKWHYILDPTHICFYSTDTFQWIAKKLDARLEIIGKDVILLGKPGN